MVALARAIATLDPVGPVKPGDALDPLARDLLPATVRAGLDVVALAARGPWAGRAVRGALLGLVEHLELRTRVIDRVARAALGRGVRQMVILGAGLDARAWRLAEADGAVVFEIDHPATQRYKESRVPSSGRDVRFVAVDFERDSLDARMAEAGHAAAEPTMWIWEGVTPYLAPEAIEATLRVVASRSAAGSTLAVTYATPSMASVATSLHPWIHRAFALIAEPLRGLIPTGEMRARLEEAGFRVVDDTGVAEWAASLGTARMPLFRIAERLAVAEKR